MTLVFIVIFAAVFCWPNPAKYVFLASDLSISLILPLYVMWLGPEISLDYVFAWRAKGKGDPGFGASSSFCVSCHRYGIFAGDNI